MRLFIATLAILVAGAFCAESDPAPPDLRQRLDKAVAAESRGDFRAALELYTKASADYSDYAEAWAALGEHLRFYVHDAKAASVAFEKALAAPRNDANASAFAWRGLGELAAKEQRDDAAIEMFKKSLAALPLADTHRSLCHLYCRQRKFKEAAEQARAAVKLNGDDPIARLLFAAQLHRAGETAEAQHEFEKALTDAKTNERGESTEPVHCCVLYNAAGYLGVCGKPDAAMTMLKKFFATPNHRHLTREEIEGDADFEILISKPEFKAMMDSEFAKPETKN
jgi:tetratricopeptide (TPR) repeat protein